jgi:cytidylate kinase
MEDVRSNLAQRDHMDSTREVSPLRKADDAIVLDNSQMTPEEQLGLVLQWASEKINA